MTQAQRLAYRATWRRREVFRYRRWLYWRSDAGRKRLHNDAAWHAQRGKWWNLYIDARDKRAWYDKQIAAHAPKPSTTEGLTTFDGHPVANWIVPILVWARQHGWTGSVVSGYRSRASQWAAAVKYGLWHYAGGNPFRSNHLSYTYPGGAVDVTEYNQLARVLRSYPGRRKLLWAGPTIGDFVHFSSNGH